MKVNGKQYAIKMTKADGSVSVTAREGMAKAYLVAEPGASIEPILLTSENVEAIVNDNAEGLWVDLNEVENQALIDCVIMTQKTPADAYRAATRGE
jgi:hypothetical protein